MENQIAIGHEYSYATFYMKISNQGQAIISWQGPTMPKIFLEVRNPNDPSGKTFLSFHCPDGFEVTYSDAHANDSIQTNFPSGQFPVTTPIQFTDIQGGTFKARSNMNVLYTPAQNIPENRAWSLPAKPLEGSLKIIGQNPPKSEVENYINEIILFRICRELSGCSMFDNNGMPLYNNTYNGYGLFALENCTRDQRWNWKSNINKAREIYNDKVSLSNQYSKAMCDQNKGLPPLNPQQIKINAAQLFDKLDSNHYWTPKQTGFLWWKKWNWVPKIAGGNRMGDRVQK